MSDPRNHGQMIKTHTPTLCYPHERQKSPDDRCWGHRPISTTVVTIAHFHHIDIDKRIAPVVLYKAQCTNVFYVNVPNIWFVASADVPARGFRTPANPLLSPLVIIIFQLALRLDSTRSISSL